MAGTPPPGHPAGPGEDMLSPAISQQDYRFQQMVEGYLELCQELWAELLRVVQQAAEHLPVWKRTASVAGAEHEQEQNIALPKEEQEQNL